MTYEDTKKQLAYQLTIQILDKMTRYSYKRIAFAEYSGSIFNHVMFRSSQVMTLFSFDLVHLGPLLLTWINFDLNMDK